MVSLAQVKKLDNQMGILMHHLKPWMQQLITESEDLLEKRLEAIMDHKIQVVHKWLDAIDVQVQERPAPTIDMASIQTK